MTAERPDVLELAKQLIAIESHKLYGGREAAVGRFLTDWFQERGVEAELQFVEDERSNVIARIPGEDDGPSLMLCGHLDTVPAGDMLDAFTPCVTHGALWGRGACDMKGAVAAMACVMADVARDCALSRSGGLQGDLVFLGTVDEETGGLGVKAAIDAGVRADYAIVGEPTDLRVALAHKGACFVRIILSGRGAHGSCPEEGVSAVSYAARLVCAIEGALRKKLSDRTHPLLGCSTVNVGALRGGTQPNIVAERCEIEIDRRMVPGDDDPLAELRVLAETVCGGVDGLSVDVEESRMSSVVPHKALETLPDSQIARAALEACRETALPQETIGVTYWSDGGHLAAHGVETIVFGPGRIVDAHSSQDRVAIADLDTAATWYLWMIRELLGVSAPNT